MKLLHFALCALLACPLAFATAAVAPKLTDEEKARFDDAAEYSKAANGLSLLIMRNGEVVYEDYAPIWNADKPHLLGIGTMSFVGVLAACAAHDGILKFDELVSDTLVEWKDGSSKEKITIRQLLGMCSGIEGNNAMNAMPTFRLAVMLSELTAEPGERFSMGPVPVHCFGELLRRKLARQNLGVGDYLERRLLAPLGVRVGFWRRDTDGDPILFSAAFLTAREWAKLGELVRTGGFWKDRQLVREEHIAQCLKVQPAHPAYGLGWWHVSVDDPGLTLIAEGRADRPVKSTEPKKPPFVVPPGIYAAVGKGKQRCYVVRSQQMVIVRMGDTSLKEFTDSEFLGRILGR